MVVDEQARTLASRKSKPSVDVDRALELSGWEVPDDGPRPVTAVSITSPHEVVRTPSRAGKKPTGSTTKLPNAPLDGWGDVDSDALFRPDGVVDGGVDSGPSTSGLPYEAELLARREARIEALAKHQGKPPPVYPKAPLKQALRQRTLAVMELAPPDGLPPDAVLQSPTKSPLRKPLITHRRRDSSDTDDAKLPTLKRGSAAQALAALKTHAPPPRTMVGLFGPHIDDSLEMRALIFQRFLPVWSLMPSRVAASHEASAGGLQGSPPRSSSASAVAKDTKSPFECSMVLMKICKAIGIALSMCPPPDVWTSAKRRGSTTTATAMTGNKAHHSDVDLETFGAFVVCNALQPAMHHFRLDRDGHEYLHTIDVVVHSLVTRAEPEPDTNSLSPWRLRELSELQPVLPLWKKGILAVQKQAPLVKTSPSASPFLTTAIADTLGGGGGGGGDDDPAPAYTVVPSTGDTLVTATLVRKLPASEARATQDANLRRKIQLRKSWQSRMVASDPLVHVGPSASSTALETVADVSDNASSLGSCIRVEAALRPPSCASVPTPSREPADNQEADLSPHGADDEQQASHEKPETQLLLLCGACPAEQEATLWCSSCFAVYCTNCWTSTHYSTVDLSAVTNQCEWPAPSARPLRTHREDRLAPPVAMLYLPTRPLASGKLLRGPAKAHTNQCDDDHEPASDPDEAPRRLPPSLSSHAILPALKPARQKPTGLVKNSMHHRSAPVLAATAPPPASAMDSTANLLKALMLGTASSSSVLGTSNSGSPWSSSSSNSKRGEAAPTRGSKDPVRKRTNLQPKAITLDAATLFPE